MEREKEKQEGNRKRELDIENFQGTLMHVREGWMLPEHKLLGKAKDKAGEGGKKEAVN